MRYDKEREAKGGAIMFGYVKTATSELRLREWECYRAYYCGLCQSLLKRYGAMGQITLSYDMTFAAMLLSSLYEPDTDSSKCACVAHPFERHPFVKNVVIDYGYRQILKGTGQKCSGRALGACSAKRVSRKGVFTGKRKI